MNELDIRIAVLAQGIKDKAIAGRLTDRHWRLAARKTGRSILKVGELVKRMEMDVCLLTDYDAPLCHKLAFPSKLCSREIFDTSGLGAAAVFGRIR